MSPFTRRMQQGAIQLGQTSDGRPTGPGYVRYEDLYQSGDSVTGAMNRLTTPAIVTFPEDEFLLNDFISYTASGVQTTGAINCDSNLVRGMIGSGKGTLGGSTGTVFRMVANSSTLGGTAAAPTQAQGGTTQVWIIRAVGNNGPMTFKNFQIVGAAEGHNFHGLYIYKPQGNVLCEDLLIAGTEGDNGAPPGETFGLSTSMQSSYQITYNNVEFDGRRSTAAGAEWFGAGGLTVEKTVGATINNCSAHHQRVSSCFVFYHTYNSTLNDCVWGTSDPPQITTGTYGHSVNHEVCSGIVHNNCTYHMSTQNQGTHITFSNNHMTDTVDGTTYSCVNGTLKLVNPTWNDVWGDSYLYIQSWLTGTDGTTNDDSMVDPPLVVQSDGATHIPYKWAHGTNQLIT